jgi:hypothetical protein
MKLHEVKEALKKIESLNFQLPDKTLVPVHFHVTEVGQITKKFIDCGGTVRDEKTVNFQLWEAHDYDHRLAPQKLLSIIELSEKVLDIENAEIEVEYQQNTIGKYGLEFDGTYFQLTAKTTACLAQDQCGIPPAKQKVQLSELQSSKNSCTPGGGCC